MSDLSLRNEMISVFEADEAADAVVRSLSEAQVRNLLSKVVYQFMMDGGIEADTSVTEEVSERMPHHPYYVVDTFRVQLVANAAQALCNLLPGGVSQDHIVQMLTLDTVQDRTYHGPEIF